MSIFKRNSGQNRFTCTSAVRQLAPAQSLRQRGWIMLESLLALTLLASLGSVMMYQQQRTGRFLVKEQHRLQQLLDQVDRFEQRYSVYIKYSTWKTGLNNTILLTHCQPPVT